MPPDPPLLVLDDVWLHYGKVAALKGVALEVHAGEMVALIGANGAGKTSILRTVSGLHHPSRGSIRLDGQAIDRLPPHRIVGLGVSQAPEGRGVFPGMSVADNIAMGAYGRRDRPGIATDTHRVYDLFPVLGERRSQAAGTLSGGEQQMLAIGRALMAKPRVLLLDEPSMGLAPKLVAQILSIVVDINRDGTTVLLVEQNARAALRRAHRAYVLESGRVVLTAPAADLLGDPSVQRAYLGGDVAVAAPDIEAS